MIRLHRLGDIPHMYGNLAHESNVVNAVDSFLDSLPSVLVGLGLGGEHTAFEAVLVVIMGGCEKHLPWMESRVKMDQRLRRWDLGQSRTIIF